MANHLRNFQEKQVKEAAGAMEKYMQVEVKAVPSSSSFGKIIMVFIKAVNIFRWISSLSSSLSYFKRKPKMSEMKVS